MAQVAQLTIAIDAQNKASAQLKQVQDSAEGAGLGFKSMAGAMALGNLAAEGISKGVEVLHSTISKAIEENNSMAASWSQINGILGNTADKTGITKDQVAKLTEGISKNTPVSEGAALAATQMILPFTQIGKQTFPLVLQASTDLATHLNKGLAPSSDQVAASAQKLGKAFADPEHAAGVLKKAGVSLTDSQKESIKTMQDQGNLVGAQQQLYQDLANTIGGAAYNAGQTFSGKMTELKNNMIETAAQGVKKLQDALLNLYDWWNKHSAAIKKVADQVLNYLKPSFEALWNTIENKVWPTMQKLYEQVLKPLLPILGVALVVAIKLLVNWWNIVLTVISAVVGWLIKHKDIVVALGGAILIMVAAFKIFEGVKTIIEIVKGAWIAFQAVMETNPIILIITAIIAIGILLMLHWKQVSAFATQIWKDISQAFQGLWNDLKQWFDDGINFIKTHWALIVDILLGPIGFVITQFIQHFGQIKQGFLDVVNFIVGIWSGIPGFFSNIWAGIKHAVGQVGDVLRSVFKDAFNAIIGLWDDTMGKLFHGQRINVGPAHFDLPNLSIPKMALGGDVDAGQAVIWGEAGREAFVPSTAGTILPNSRTNGGMNTHDHSKHVTITQHITYARQSDPTANARRLAFELMRR